MSEWRPWRRSPTNSSSSISYNSCLVSKSNFALTNVFRVLLLFARRRVRRGDCPEALSSFPLPTTCSPCGHFSSSRNSSSATGRRHRFIFPLPPVTYCPPPLVLSFVTRNFPSRSIGESSILWFICCQGQIVLRPLRLELVLTPQNRL